MSERLLSLRAALNKESIDGFILPVNDEFMGEYVPVSAKRLEWLTGFTGSAGLAVVLKDKAAFFTDGRYTLQAQTQVTEFELYNSGDVSPEKWLSQNANDGDIIAYDPKLHTLQALRRYEKQAPHVIWQPVSPNPIDALWKNRPVAPASEAISQPLEYAGEASAVKRRRMAALVTEAGADAFIMTAPDSICWLLNLRGSDVPFTPFLLCNALLDSTGQLTFYIDHLRMSEAVRAGLGSGVTFKMPQDLDHDLAGLSGKRVLYDPANAPVWFYQQLVKAGAKVVEGIDPCQLPKACKNEVELEGMRQAHIRDGLAVTKFLCWLEHEVAAGEKLTEISVAEKLESLRKESNLYIQPSFSTISGSGPNGAIVHYHATRESNRTVENNSLLLVDSGGQYPDGTTDITRTIAIGTPTAEMKKHFTLVLKGHIALATAVFPEGTNGMQLDALARQYLWHAQLDYDHGTGHGVGSYLSVHEGPQRVSKRGSDAALMPGMIISNEPGYYRAGHYGIRIESLLAVRDSGKTQEGRQFFGFETITLAPIDMKLIDKTMLTKEELSWLQEYHRGIYRIHSSKLTLDEAGWLSKSCQ